MFRTLHSNAFSHVGISSFTGMMNKINDDDKDSSHTSPIRLISLILEAIPVKDFVIGLPSFLDMMFKVYLTT
jgi:hypothetical protein